MPALPLDHMEWLYERGREAEQAGEFARAVSLLSQANALATQHADLPARIRIRYWWAKAHQRTHLADAQGMKGYRWLMALTTQAHTLAALQAEPESLRYLAAAYAGFVEMGRYHPALSTRDLHEVIDEGLHFLVRIGQPGWRHTLHLQRGGLLQAEDRLEEARLELEQAAALRRQDPNSLGPSLGVHLCQLGEVLLDLTAYEEAARTYREVWQGDPALFDPADKQWALVGLAESAAFLGNLEVAQQRARGAVALANQLKSPAAQIGARCALIGILIRQGEVRELSHEATQLWHWVRQGGTTDNWLWLGYALARVRLAQARSLVGAPPNPDLAIVAPLETSRKRRRAAQQRLEQASRWAERASAAARHLHEQTGTAFRDEFLDELARQIAHIQSWMRGRPSS